MNQPNDEANARAAIVAACRAIIKGYAEEKSALDNDMLEHLINLSNHAELIESLAKEG